MPPFRTDFKRLNAALRTNSKLTMRMNAALRMIKNLNAALRANSKLIMLKNAALQLKAKNAQEE
jgi:hypothetical protein